MTAEHTTRGSGQEGTARTVTVDVELTEPFVEMIQRVKDSDESLGDWLAQAAETRFSLYNVEEFAAPVDIPEEAVEWAELRAEHARQKGKEDVHVADYVCEHADLQFQYPDEESE